MIKIISDGINHKVVDRDGKMIQGISSITIEEILPYQLITARLLFVGVQLEITSNNVFEEHFNLKPPKE
jgi:hypothetical protein